MEALAKRYLKDLSAALALYGTLLASSIVVLQKFELGSFKFVVAVLPMIAVAFVIAAVMRGLSNLDEQSGCLASVGCGFGP